MNAHRQSPAPTFPDDWQVLPEGAGAERERGIEVRIGSFEAGKLKAVRSVWVGPD